MSLQMSTQVERKMEAEISSGTVTRLSRPGQRRKRQCSNAVPKKRPRQEGRYKGSSCSENTQSAFLNTSKLRKQKRQSPCAMPLQKIETEAADSDVNVNATVDAPFIDTKSVQNNNICLADISNRGSQNVNVSQDMVEISSHGTLEITLTDENNNINENITDQFHIQPQLIENPQIGIFNVNNSIFRNEHFRHDSIPLRQPITALQSVTYVEEHYEELENETTDYIALNNIPNDVENTYVNPPKYKYKKLCYILLISAIFVFCIILAGGASALFVWIVLNSGGILVLDSIARTYLSNAETVHLVINSFQQINTNPIYTNPNIEYIITFNLSDPEKWPNEFTLHKADKIIEINIEGHFTADVLIKVLGQATNIKRLSLKNEGEKFCLAKASLNFDDGSSDESKLRLNSLESLTIEHFTVSCNEVFNVISSHIAMNSLKEFSLKGSVVSVGNAGVIQNILRDSRHTINHIEFINTNLTTSIFHWANIGKMTNATSLVFDVWKEVKVTNYFETDFFAENLPNLNRFSFGSQPRTLIESKAVYNLRNLKELNMSVSLPPGVSNYSVAFLHNKFSNLENATIKLNFEYCDVTNMREKERGRNYILDLHVLPDELLDNINIETNCKLLTGYEGDNEEK